MIGFGNEPNLVFALTFRQFCRKVSARRRHGGLGRAPASAFVIQMLCLLQRRHRRRWYLKGADNTPYEKIGDEVRSLADEVPFDIPDSWEWVRLGSIVYNRGQITPSTDFCYIDIGSIDNKNQKLNPTDTVIAPDKAPSRARKLVDKGDVLYSTVRPYLHNMCIVDRDFSCIPIASTGFAVLTCHAELCNKFLLYYMMSPDFDAYANNTDNAKGVAYPAINDDRLYKALIPIPPLGEQFRIVSAIESVDASIRDYGVKEEALRALNGSFPESLKKSILQEAVQGKLVPQDPSDEPAEALLERIRVEKQRLIKEGKIKKDKHESVIFRRDNSHYEKRGSEEVCIDEEIPFEIPDNWAWARLSSFGVFSSGKTPSMSNPQFWNGSIPWVTSKDMKRPVITDSEMHISESAASTMQLYSAGTLLLVARSGILKRLLPLCKLGIDSTTNQDIKAFSLYDIELSEWLFYGIKAFEPYILKELVKSVTTVESLKFDEFSAMLIPVPPLSEQRRIIVAIKAAINLLTPLSSNPLFSL